MFVQLLIKPRLLNSTLFMQRPLQSRLSKRADQKTGEEERRRKREGKSENGRKRRGTYTYSCRWRTSWAFSFTPLVYIPEIRGAVIFICFQQTFLSILASFAKSLRVDCELAWWIGKNLLILEKRPLLHIFCYIIKHMFWIIHFCLHDMMGVRVTHSNCNWKK